MTVTHHVEKDAVVRWRDILSDDGGFFDPSKSTWDGDPTKIGGALGIPDCFGIWDDSGRLKQHYVTSWICTDTEVGICVYTLDGEKVAVGNQSARKSTEHIFFVSKLAADKCREYVLSLLPEPEQNFPPIVDMDSIIHNSWFNNHQGPYGKEY